MFDKYIKESPIVSLLVDYPTISYMVVEQAMRFQDRDRSNFASYLSRTPSSTGDRKEWTWPLAKEVQSEIGMQCEARV